MIVDHKWFCIRCNKVWNLAIDNFNPDSFIGSQISVSVIPKNFEITPVRNQILLISGATIDIYDDTTGLLVSTGSITTLGTTETTDDTSIATTITV